MNLPKNKTKLSEIYLGEGEIIARNSYINKKDWELLENLFRDTAGFRTYAPGAILHQIAEGFRKLNITTYEQRIEDARFRNPTSVLTITDPFR